MLNLISIDRLKSVRRRAFSYRISANAVVSLMLAIGFAVVTGLAAQIKFGLPGTPVPITMQTFAVLLAGVVLGPGWGAVSMVIYLAVGGLGVPWFSGFSGGMTSLTGATAGYLAGFIPAALFMGYISDRNPRLRRFTPMVLLMCVGNFVFIHIPGLAALFFWVKAATGTAPGIYTVFSMGTLPYIVGDLLKIAAAAFIAWILLPKKGTQPEYFMKGSFSDYSLND